jgi:hypothetical protein
LKKGFDETTHFRSVHCSSAFCGLRWGRILDSVNFGNDANDSTELCGNDRTTEKADCGSPVKIGTDATASSVNRTPQPTSIATLIALPVPQSPPSNSRANATEETTFQLTNVTVIQISLEHDNDYHLVVRDRNGDTMLLEIPNPACAKSSAFFSQISATRTLVDLTYGQVSGTIKPGSMATAQGIGFFDAYYGLQYQAKNGIELHPLTALCFGQNCSL